MSTRPPLPAARPGSAPPTRPDQPPAARGQSWRQSSAGPSRIGVALSELLAAAPPAPEPAPARRAAPKRSRKTPAFSRRDGYLFLHPRSPRDDELDACRDGRTPRQFYAFRESPVLRDDGTLAPGEPASAEVLLPGICRPPEWDDPTETAAAFAAAESAAADSGRDPEAPLRCVLSTKRSGASGVDSVEVSAYILPAPGERKTGAAAPRFLKLVSAPLSPAARRHNYSLKSGKLWVFETFCTALEPPHFNTVKVRAYPLDGGAPLCFFFLDPPASGSPDGAEPRGDAGALNFYFAMTPFVYQETGPLATFACVFTTKKPYRSQLPASRLRVWDVSPGGPDLAPAEKRLRGVPDDGLAGRVARIAFSSPRINAPLAGLNPLSLKVCANGWYWLKAVRVSKPGGSETRTLVNHYFLLALTPGAIAAADVAFELVAQKIDEGGAWPSRSGIQTSARIPVSDLAGPFFPLCPIGERCPHGARCPLRPEQPSAFGLPVETGYEVVHHPLCAPKSADPSALMYDVVKVVPGENSALLAGPALIGGCVFVDTEGILDRPGKPDWAPAPLVRIEDL